MSTMTARSARARWSMLVYWNIPRAIGLGPGAAKALEKGGGIRLMCGMDQNGNIKKVQMPQAWVRCVHVSHLPE